LRIKSAGVGKLPADSAGAVVASAAADGAVDGDGVEDDAEATANGAVVGDEADATTEPPAGPAEGAVAGDEATVGPATGVLG
jgi:hypothetical protein